jgi:4-hydroxy-tetrahydrodipicolinate synthase
LRTYFHNPNTIRYYLSESRQSYGPPEKKNTLIKEWFAMVNTENKLFFGAASDLIAPFNEEGYIDHSLLEKEVDFLIENGVTGLFVNGLAGETLMMSFKERLEVLATAVKATRKRAPIMSNVTFNNIHEAKDFIHESEKLGVDAVIITPPVVYKYSDQALFNHFNSLAESTKLPVYIYNAPETGNKISPEIIAQLFQTTPNFWGYKDSTQDAIHQLTVLRLIGEERHFELLAGSDALIVTTMMHGGVGILSLVTSVFPRLIVEVCTAADNGDWAKALEIQNKILRVRQALKVGPFMAAYKYVGNLIGTPLGRMKYPLNELNESEKGKVKDILVEQGMI